jgi:cytochrome oxidase Cu insertion factor (SCO1/SenC/PrrC family)
MMNRRELLGIAAEEPRCALPASYFPDVVVHTHDGRRARFWSDLVRGKTVLLHFMSVRDAAYPTTANLARVQELLGERMGRDVFLYSLTIDPEHDTPQALRRFAAAHGAGPGWVFLTGEPAAMELLRARLFVHAAEAEAPNTEAAGHAGHGAAAAMDCSRGLLRYGNAAVGLWGSVPAKADPAWIAERIAWLTPRAPAAGPPRRRGPLPLAGAALLLALAATAGLAQHPHQQPKLKPTCQTTAGNVTTVVTGESLFPPSFPFVDPPGTNLLPTVYTNLFDSLGREIPNTLPSTPTIPYNLHDGTPEVTQINPISPTDDLQALWSRLGDMAGRGGPRDPVEERLVQEAIATGIDILEGNPVRNRAYSGLPLLHYTGPLKIKQVEPVFDAQGKAVGGNVDVHQVWYDNHFESDTGLLDVSQIGDVPWTVTYTIDVLSRGEDDFSPYTMYWDLVPPNAPPPVPPPAPCVPPAPPPAGKQPGFGMDQTFFPLQEGTRTVIKIKMAPAEYYKLIYTWGWRMHPPRVQVMDDANGKVAGKTLAEWEIETFGADPRASEEAKLEAIEQIGDLSPAKKMWQALRDARDAAAARDWRRVGALAAKGREAFQDWKERNQLPAGVDMDREADLTLFYVNNTIYGEFTDGGLTNFPSWQTRGAQLKVTLINGDYYQRGYLNVDFGGGRGWENQYKSSVKVAGSGCWFTFGRNYWWINTATPVMLQPATRKPYQATVQKVHITFNFDPGRRLRFYQFDPLHHDVAVFSVH